MRTTRRIRTVRRRSGGLRRGHTLVELVASTAAIGFLLAGMGSAIFVTSRAATPADLPVHTIRGSAAAEQIAAELHSARSFLERSSTAVEFTVPDRNADASDETIRYAWSAVAGDPITRQYNGGGVVDFLENVNAFDLGYEVQTVVDPDTGDRYYVRCIVVVLQAGSDNGARIRTRIAVLNAPEVATP